MPLLEALLLGLAMAAVASDSDGLRPASAGETLRLREQQLRDATALHDRAVAAEDRDLELALQLYSQALQVRPAQWESSLRLGTLLMGWRGRHAEAEAALRYTVALADQRAGVDHCAPRTNLGVLLTERAFGSGHGAGATHSAAALRSAPAVAVEALAQFDIAVRAGSCNVARLNAARLLTEAADAAPLPVGAVPDELGLLGASPEALRAAAAKQYIAALATALLEDDMDTVEGAARKYARLRPGGAGPALNAPQHAIVGRAAVHEGDTDGAKFHTAAALRLDPNSHTAYHTLGLLAERAGNLEESIVAYRTAVTLAAAQTQSDIDHGRPRRAATLDATASASNNLGRLARLGTTLVSFSSSVSNFVHFVPSLS